MYNLGMKTFISTLTLLLISNSSFAGEVPKIEYRLSVKTGGEVLNWVQPATGERMDLTRNLERSAFLSNSDFESYSIKELPSPPHKPNTYQIELSHNKSGRKKFVRIANKDRDRPFCIVINGFIYQCAGFTPKVKKLWDQSAHIRGPFTKQKAQELVNFFNGVN